MSNAGQYLHFIHVPVINKPPADESGGKAFNSYTTTGFVYDYVQPCSAQTKFRNNLRAVQSWRTYLTKEFDSELGIVVAKTSLFNLWAIYAQMVIIEKLLFISSSGQKKRRVRRLSKI